MATVPSPRTWINEQVTGAKLNTDLRDGYNYFLSGKPRCVLRRTTNQSISTNTFTTVQWTTEDVDTDGGHSTVTNTSRYTAQTAGWYHLTAAIHWPDMNGTTSMANACFIKNGVTSTRQSRAAVYAAGNDQLTLICAGHMQLVVNDYVEVELFHNWGVSRNIGPAFGQSGDKYQIPRFEINWVSA